MRGSGTREPVFAAGCRDGRGPAESKTGQSSLALATIDAGLRKEQNE